MTLRLVCLLLLTAGWLAVGPAAAQGPAPARIYTEFEGITMPELPGPNGLPENPQAAVQRLLPPLPDIPKDGPERVFVRFVVEKDGTVSNLQVTQSVSEAADAAVLAAVRRLPRFRPGQRASQPVRVALAVGIWPGGAPATGVARPRPADQRPDTIEARNLRRGSITVSSGETPTFLWRELPVSFSRADRLITYAWHPGGYGPQLFFSAPGPDGPPAGYERRLFILDLIKPTTYTVQAFGINQSCYTSLEALFFADANHDGQKDLLVLTKCNLLEGPTEHAPLGGSVPHYQTSAFYYRAPDRAGRPRYEQQVLASLDNVATAAEVRRRLALPAKRAAAPAAKAAEPAKR